ncbi:MAG: hypothetical protein SP1CHLAM42_09190 [Chlamydiales bacterium]|nr:hypothetical protein [Chlamydiales bacterium]
MEDSGSVSCGRSAEGNESAEELTGEDIKTSGQTFKGAFIYQESNKNDKNL